MSSIRFQYTIAIVSDFGTMEIGGSFVEAAKQSQIS